MTLICLGVKASYATDSSATGKLFLDPSEYASNSTRLIAMNTLQMIPSHFQNALVAAGIHIKLVSSLVDELPDLATLSPDWGLDSGFENCPALYSPGKKTIYIAEKWRGSTHVTLAHAVIHECGHAYDDRQNISGSDAFLCLVEQDGNHLSNSLRAKFRFDKLHL